MDALIWVLVVVAVLVIGAAVAWTLTNRKRSERLSQRFGPEYERATAEVGDRRKAESELEAREKRVSQLEIRPLSAADQGRFSDDWRSVQARFVDDPPGAITEADRLVAQVMEARGYPVGNFEQRAADVSVDHPHVVENYRAARAIADRHRFGEASTEDLRQAMVHYRALFEDLLETQTANRVEASR